MRKRSDMFVVVFVLTFSGFAAAQQVTRGAIVRTEAQAGQATPPRPGTPQAPGRRTTPPARPPSAPPVQASPVATPVRPQSAADVAAAVQSGINVTGSATSESHSESIGLSRSTYLRWSVHLEVRNTTGFKATMGNDLFLVEAASDGSRFEGSSRFAA
jgi:hypothetical protein